MSRQRQDSDDIAYELVPSDDAMDEILDEAHDTKFKDEEQRGPWQVWLTSMLEGNVFQVLTCLMIVFNAVCVGMETDMPDLSYWDMIERTFLVFFTCELGLRMFAVGYKDFFDCANNQDIVWNIIDVFVVISGLVATALLMFCSGKRSIGNVTLFRSIRVVRILRILRVVRIFRFLKQLYLLAYGFVEGAMAVFWVAILAFCLIYVCAVVLVRAYRNEDNEFLQTRFSSIPSTMFTLFEIMCSPSLGMYRHEIGEYPALMAFILIYVIFGSFGISGLLTGVISESILEKNQARVESQRLDRELKRRDLFLRSSDLFEKIDVHQVGSLTIEDIMCYANDIRSLFRDACVSLPDYDFGHMFELMDYDDNGFIEKPEFISGILELCDDIRPMSIMELQSQVSRCSSKITRCSSAVDAIAESLHSLTTDLLNRNSEATRASALVTKACEILETKGQHDVQGDKERLQKMETTMHQMKHMIFDYSKSALADASVNSQSIVSPRFLPAKDHLKRRNRRTVTVSTTKPHLSRQGSNNTLSSTPKTKKVCRFDKSRFDSNQSQSDTIVDHQIAEIHRELRNRMTRACSDLNGKSDHIAYEEKRSSDPIPTTEQPYCHLEGSQINMVGFLQRVTQSQGAEPKTVDDLGIQVALPPNSQLMEPSFRDGEMPCSQLDIPIPEFSKAQSLGKTPPLCNNTKHRVLQTQVLESGTFRAAADRAIVQHRLSHQ